MLYVLSSYFYFTSKTKANTLQVFCKGKKKKWKFLQLTVGKGF